MTTTDAPDPTAGIIAAVERMLAESRAIDTKKALEGIRADRSRNNSRVGIRRTRRRTL
jgi:hypothetical protein